MSAEPGMNDLATRKRLLIQQGDIHRSLIALERLQIQERMYATREQFASQRWWLIGGLALAGTLFAKKLGGITRWIPVALSAMRIAQRFRR
jgi:hypothetical protein